MGDAGELTALHVYIVTSVQGDVCIMYKTQLL